MGSRESDTKSLKTTTWLGIIAASIIPLVGIFVWDWGVALIVIYYWLESGLVAGFNIPGILLAEGRVEDEHESTKDDVGFRAFIPEGYGNSKFAAVGAFVGIFAIFWVVQGSFLMCLVGAFFPDGSFYHEGMLGGLGVAALQQVGELFFEPEYRDRSPAAQTNVPMSRLVVVQVGMLVGYFLFIPLTPASEMGTDTQYPFLQTFFLVLFVILKTIIELVMLRNQKKPAAQRKEDTKEVSRD